MVFSNDYSNFVTKIFTHFGRQNNPNNQVIMRYEYFAWASILVKGLENRLLPLSRGKFTWLWFLSDYKFGPVLLTV